MFRSNTTCTHTRVSIDANGDPIYDMDGEPSYLSPVTIGCSVISLDLALDRTSVRADSSASRGRAEEIGGNAMILVSPVITIFERDLIDIEGSRFEVIAIWPRRRVHGGIHHQEIVLRKSRVL